MALFQCMQACEQGHHPQSLKGVVWDLEVASIMGPHPQTKQGQVLV